MSWSWMVFGGVVEALGLAVTGWGIRETWVASGTTDRFTGPFLARARHAEHQAEGWARRVFRLGGRSATVHAVAGTVTARATVTGSASVGWAPLDPAQPTTDALALLDTRIRNLLSMVQENRGADLQRVKEVRAQVTATAADVAGVRADLDAARVELAVGGLRTEAIGLGLVGLGLLIQLLGWWAFVVTLVLALALAGAAVARGTLGRGQPPPAPTAGEQ